MQQEVAELTRQVAELTEDQERQLEVELADLNELIRLGEQEAHALDYDSVWERHRESNINLPWLDRLEALTQDTQRDLGGAVIAAGVHIGKKGKRRLSPEQIMSIQRARGLRR